MQAFDDLLLMKIGGRIIYHGELGRQSSKLVAYFEVMLCPAHATNTTSAILQMPLAHHSMVYCARDSQTQRLLISHDPAWLLWCWLSSLTAALLGPALLQRAVHAYHKQPCTRALLSCWHLRSCVAGHCGGAQADRGPEPSHLDASDLHPRHAYSLLFSIHLRPTDHAYGSSGSIGPILLASLPLQHAPEPTWGHAYAGMERTIGVNFADIFAHSAMDKHNEALIEQESQPKEGAQPLSFHKQYARTTFVQVSLGAPHCCWWSQL